MNKIIFQIGLLAFFVCIVIFSSQEGSILDAISRSFLVFIGVVLFAAVVLGVSMLFTANGQTRRPDQKKYSKSDGQGRTVEVSAKTPA